MYGATEPPRRATSVHTPLTLPPPPPWLCQFARDYLHHFLVRSSFYPDNLKEAMRDAYLQTERSFMALAVSRGWESGCTAVTVLIQGDRLTVGHVGDSRAILCRQGMAVALTKDHSPDDSEEKERIEKEGAWVSKSMVGVVWLVGGPRVAPIPLTPPPTRAPDPEPCVVVCAARCVGCWVLHEALGTTTLSKGARSLVSVQRPPFRSWFCRRRTSFCC